MRHSVGAAPTAAVLTQIFTVPIGYKANVSAVTVNVGAAIAKTFTVYWKHADDPTLLVYLSRSQSAATQDSPAFSGNLIMQSGDSIWFNSEAGSIPTIICSFDLYKENNAPYL